MVENGPVMKTFAQGMLFFSLFIVPGVIANWIASTVLAPIILTSIFGWILWWVFRA